MACEPRPGAGGTTPAVELSPITDKVLHSLQGNVPRARIEALLTELLAQEFSDARVTAFLPVFLHKLACETLRSESRGADGRAR
ncbi:hypothetical protein ACPOLB_08215 [Rubrivivax sp. RP6-9]|uniref:hypothetical protein n=1 Tax=Rubrivivax sp. RP6-9 TaxID=3415750 RepID=UPI003CC56DA0